MKKSLLQRILMPLALLFGTMSAASAADRFYMDAVNIDPDETRTFAFYLENENPYFGFQGDLKLPEGLEVVTENGKPSITLSSRVDNSFQIVSNTLADGTLRFGMFSISHSSFTGNSGALLYLKVKATSEFDGGELTMKNILFIGSGDKDTAFPNILMSLGTVHYDNAFIPDFKIAVGEAKQISLELSNETSFTAFQADLVLPEGLTIQDGSLGLSQRASDHTVSAKSFSDGRTRIACLSLSNTPFSGNDGALVSFTVIADKDIADKSEMQLKNVIFTMPNAREYSLPNSVTEITSERALVESITLSPAEITMIADGSTSVIQATVLPIFASTKDLEWSSSDPEIVSVSQAGIITAKAPGKAIITAAAVDGSGVTATCDVTVNGVPVASIALNRSKASLKVGENVFLSATVLPANASDKSITWSSSDETKATVDGTGTVTAIEIGSATIKATSVSDDGITAVCEINVEPTPVSSIILDKRQTWLKVGEKLRIAATVVPETATNKTINFSSEDPQIVEIDTGGNITALSAGSTRIVAEANDESGVVSYCTVYVIQTPAESVTIDTPDRISFKVGEAIQLSATVFPENATHKTITWTSSNANIVAIDSNGMATAISVGEAIITATNSAGQTATVTMTVIPTLAESLSVFPQSITLKVGESKTVAVTVSPNTTTNKNVSFSSVDESIAIVDSNGMISGIGIGETDIIVSTEDGSSLSESIRINVVPTTAESVSIRYDGSTSLYIGQTAQLSAEVLPESAADKRVTWQVQNPGVLSVDSNGLVEALGVGESWVSATTENGKIALISFKVIPTPVSAITLNHTDISLEPSETFKLSATISPADATNKAITWSSSNPEVASVDNDGNVTARSVGESIIMAKSVDGSDVTAECRITVIAIPVESIKITANGPTELKDGETLQLTATILPENATDKSVIWRTNADYRATVDENGLVTAHSDLGVLDIWAICGDASDKIMLTIIKTPAEKISLNRASAALKVSDTIQLSASFIPETTTYKTLTWVSSDDAIATVNDDGLVTAKTVGECDVIATTTDGSDISATCHIVVGATPAESISIEPKGPFTIRNGESIQFHATVLPENATDKSVTWESATSSVIIDESGLATAVGDVENNWIRAINSAGQSDEVFITVLRTYVTSIDVDPKEVALKVNQTANISVKINPEDATHKILAWESDDDYIASVDSYGRITAHAIGKTTVTVSAKDGSGVNTRIPVNVVPNAAESIVINTPQTTDLKVGEFIQLSATVGPVDAWDKSVVWSSSDAEVVSVDASGLAVANGIGTAVITATNSAGQNAEITLTVLPTIAESLILTNTEVNMQMGETFQLTALFTPATTTNKTLKWESTNPSIISVDNNGLLTAHALGEATVSATTTDGSNLTASCTIWVNPTPVEGISIVYEGPTTIKVGDVIQLGVDIKPDNATDKSVTWGVQIAEILNVTQDGKLTAVGPGEAWVGVEASNGSFAYLVFTVESVKVERIEIEPAYASLKVGETVQLTAVITPSNATNQHIIWDSNDTNIASVDAHGLVKAIGIGATDINARATDGSGTIQALRVNVVSTPVESITISANGPTELKDGETLQLTATVLPENATDKSVRWISNADYSATVDENGLVTAHSDLGVLDIYAIAGNVSDKIMLTIIETPAENISLSSDISEIRDKETISIYAQINPETTTNKSVTWNVSDESILKIQDWDNSVCVLVGQKPGEAYVTATTVNGIVQSYFVTVKPIYIQSITIPSEITVATGSQYEFMPEVLPENASNKFLVWESSNPSLGSFYGNVFYAHARGEITATCRAVDGSDVYAQCHIKIAAYAKTLTLNEHVLNLEEKDAFRLIATIEPIDAVDSGPIVWNSSNSEVADVNDDGLVSALSEGEAIITARTKFYPWATDECKIRVRKFSDIESISVDDVSVMIDGRNITVDGLYSGAFVRLIALDGRILNQGLFDGRPIQFRVPVCGVYILSVGKYSLKITIK